MTVTSASTVARGQLYRFLAAVYLRPPSATLVAPFLDAETLAELADRFGTDAVADLVEFRAGFDGDYGALDQQYQDLFVVPLGRYVTPYEAVYRDERILGDEVVRGLLMGPSTLGVRALYRAAGLEIAPELRELPDHIGLELACMAMLCDAEAHALEQGDAAAVARARDLQRRLLREHLLQWVPALCARVRAQAQGALYRGLAALTEALLRREAAELDGCA
jgi:TorA maturation chaperone TorD